MFTSSDAIHQVLDTFYQCKNNGLSCRLFMETSNGQQFISLQIPEGSATRKTKLNSGNKSPSTVRRDRARLEKWKLRKYSNPSNSTSSKLVENYKDSFKDTSSILKENPLKNVGEENSTSLETFSDDFSPLPPFQSTAKTSDKSSSKTNQIKDKDASIDKETSKHLETGSISNSHEYGFIKSYLQTMNEQLKTMYKKSEDTSPPGIEDTSEIVCDDNSEDHLFEEAALWAKKQKKDFKM